jgi:site-specific recombinase, phage integrase family
MKMRNPNGYGSVIKLKGKRRKPFAVRVTTHWDDNGKQRYKYLGYYKTQKEANQQLFYYNEHPYNIDVQNITFAEVYEKWKIEKFEMVGHSSQLGYIAAFKTCESLHQIRFVDLKSSNLQEIVGNPEIKYGSKRKIKVLFNQLYAYAMKNDIISKDYSKYIDIGKNTEESTRKPFTNKEIERLWDLLDENDWIDTILILIYTGFRIGELLEIKNSDIDLENRIVKGGLKTEAGKDRLVPIHSKILELVKNRMDSNNEYLIVNFKGEQMKYNNYYREKFEPIMEELGMKHKPHDTRHTFATLLSNADANKTSVKKLIGHNSYTTTEKFYTHKDIEELRKAVEKI